MDWKNTEIPFDAISALAYIIVDDVIKSAEQVVIKEQLEKAGIASPTVVPSREKFFAEPSSVAEAKYEVKNIKWLTCKEFTTTKGLMKIEEYMKTWELHKSWLHWTNYIEEEELQYSTRYHYRVRWSIPTCRKPIPRATANVYFIISISKIKPEARSMQI
ncbi:A-kinase anchor protein 14 isoform X2 [Sphaerodactylus townsendi]|uniref:A-kinase anchor protein 14 isoform X2 n=1 Tax=Sphaerodactylus townsendi TaxID=933632 RepID=UPI0020265B0B|nr:A-kinase anchor protein 14 isoform X2 [Sphaerodactylus townsendi]